jgi:hypothetical protein
MNTPETDSEKKERRIKAKKLALIATGSTVGAGIGALGATNLFLKEASQAHSNLNTKRGNVVRNKIVAAHMLSTGTSYPEIITATPDMPERMQQGVYLPRALSKLGNKMGIPNKGTGTVILSQNPNAFILAHELGHRAQDYHPIAGPLQTAGNIVAGFSPLTSAVIHTLSKKSETNKEALAKGLLASYAMHTPRIASEVAATLTGRKYLKIAGESPSTLASVLQPIGYALAPITEAMFPIVTGRVHKHLANKVKQLREKRKQEQNKDQLQTS